MPLAYNYPDHMTAYRWCAYTSTEEVHGMQHLSEDGQVCALTCRVCAEEPLLEPA